MELKLTGPFTIFTTRVKMEKESDGNATKETAQLLLTQVMNIASSHKRVITTMLFQYLLVLLTPPPPRLQTLMLPQLI